MNPYETPQYEAIKEFWMEPDYFQDTMNGFKIMARRNWSKAWCGYAGVSEIHPLFGKGYDERIPVPDRGAVTIDKVSLLTTVCEALHEDDGQVSLAALINVHGGITYAGDKWPADDGLWYFGFDCSHYNDLTPRNVFDSFSDGIWRFDTEAKYRTLDFVKAELETLTKVLENFA